MKPYNGYLIDLDGTMYWGKQKIDAAGDFIRRLKEQGKTYQFVTNNATMTAKQVADKLQSFGVEAVEEQVLTSAMACARFIAEKTQHRSVYVIGEEGLFDAMDRMNIPITDEHPDAVVIGMDRNIDYEKLAKGCIALQHGAAFISTNADATIPTERGLLPGNGSLTAVLATATGRCPLYIGKPEATMMVHALADLGTDADNTLVVGDNYDTDIRAGINANLDTLLVLTGVTSRNALQASLTPPTYVVDSLREWMIS